jgi:tetratricopeptide (TPR) repeat protein
MTRISFSRLAACIVLAALCAAILPAQPPDGPPQNANNPPLQTSKQISDDEEKGLLADVQAAESADANPKELAAKLEALARFYSSQNRKVELSAVLGRELAAADKAWPNPNNDPASVRILGHIAMGYNLCNQRDLAKQIYLRILEIDTKRYGINNENVASDLVNLGRTSTFGEDPTEAEDFFMRALAIDQLQKNDRAAVPVIQALSMLASHQKNPERADAILAREIEALKLSGDRNATQIAMLLSDRSRIASNRGDSAAASEFLKQSLEITERTHGNNSVLNVAPLTVLADQAMRNGDLNSAELYAVQAVKVAESNDNDTRHIGVIKPLTELARIYRKQQKYSESEATFMRAIDLVIHGRGADSPELADVTFQLAGLYSDEEKNAEAETQYLRTIKLSENDQGIYGHNLPQYLAGYAYFLHKLNRNDEAKKTMQRAEAVQAGFRASVQNQTPKM